MAIYYLRVNKNNNTRKIAIDMAFLAKHKLIRLPKYYFEENLYLPIMNKSGDDNKVEEYYLSSDKIMKEDEDFYYFKFPFKHNQVVDVAV
ncbi:MAG: hypothetical protein P8X73_12955 [Ignavibacteriaceae bacterium]|jgi:hypothetical protein